MARFLTPFSKVYQFSCRQALQHPLVRRNPMTKTMPPMGTSKNPSNKNLHLVLHVHPMNEAFLHGAPDEAGRIF
jgi:hypothetical protein